MEFQERMRTQITCANNHTLLALCAPAPCLPLRQATPASPPSADAPGPAHTEAGPAADVQGLTASASGTTAAEGPAGGDPGAAGSGSHAGHGQGGLDYPAVANREDEAEVKGEGAGGGEAGDEAAKAAARATRKARNQAAYEARRLFNNTKRREKAKATKQAKAAALK